MGWNAPHRSFNDFFGLILKVIPDNLSVTANGLKFRFLVIIRAAPYVDENLSQIIL